MEVLQTCEQKETSSSETTAQDNTTTRGQLAETSNLSNVTSFVLVQERRIAAFTLLILAVSKNKNVPGGIKETFLFWQGFTTDRHVFVKNGHQDLHIFSWIVDQVVQTLNGLTSLALLDEEIYLLLKQISLLEIMAVLLLLLLPLLAVDLEVETSRTPLLWTHTSSNTLLRR